VAGLQLINRNGITHISIRNLPTPLVLLNGVPLNIVSLGSGESEDLYYALLSVDPTDVERIEILKTQATASIYGLQGTNGVKYKVDKTSFPFHYFFSCKFHSYFVSILNRSTSK
jgi:outer membrane receptor protein involved in Fe transport